MNKINYLKWGIKKQFQAWTGKELNYSSEYNSKNGEKIELFGSMYGGWWVCTKGINKDSIIYDVGLGKDISFSLSLIERFGMKIWGFDPTPVSMDWLKSQNLPKQLEVFPIALSDEDGELVLYSPEDETFASFSIAEISKKKEFRAEALRLSSMMKRFGHSHIDILKMDIEGAEYNVISNILSEKIPVRQILVEVHHSIYPEFSIEQSRNMIESLRKAGYKIFKVSHSRCEYHFIKE